MLVEKRTFYAGKDKYQIIMLATITGNGIVAQIFGGEKAHVGAVALSIPGPGVAGPEKVSCSTTVVPLLGHKDDEVARPVAEELAKTWGSPVVVVAGIHIDNAGKEDIRELLNNCREVTRALIRELEGLKKRSCIF